MKSFLRFILSVALAAGPGVVDAESSSAGILMLARTSNDISDFEFSAIRAKSGGADVIIRCIGECAKPTERYRENTGLSPGWVLLPKDGSTRFISVWTSGSAYAVMVHDIGGSKVVKVLEVGSRIPPSVALDAKGNEFFQLCTEDSGCSEYHWDGTKYIVKYIGKWANPATARK